MLRAFKRGVPLQVRNPDATRPWQHVLEPVLGYMALAEHLLEGGADYAEAFNFGPAPAGAVPVAEIVDRLVALWGAGARWQQDPGSHPHEAAMLTLEFGQGREAPRLAAGDRPRPGACHDGGLVQGFCEGADIRQRTIEQIDSVLARDGEA